MTFDYIVGNPPYQEPNTIHQKTKKDRDTNGGSKLFYQILQRLYDKYRCSMSMVTPAKIGSKKLLFARGLKDYHLEGDVFDLGLEIAVWRLVKDYQGFVTVHYQNHTEQITEGPIFPENKREVFELYQKSKSYIKGRPFLGGLGEASKKDMITKQTVDHQWPVKVKMDSTHGKETFMFSKVQFKGNRKLVIPMSQKLFPKTVLDTTDTFTNLFHCIDVSSYSEEQISNLKDYLCSYPLQVYAEFVAKSIGSLRYFFIPVEALGKMNTTEIIKSLGWTKQDFKKVEEGLSPWLLEFAKGHEGTTGTK